MWNVCLSDVFIANNFISKMLRCSAYAIFRNENNIYIVMRVLITVAQWNRYTQSIHAKMWNELKARVVRMSYIKNAIPLSPHRRIFERYTHKKNIVSSLQISFPLRLTPRKKRVFTILHSVCLEYFCVYFFHCLLSLWWEEQEYAYIHDIVKEPWIFLHRNIRVHFCCLLNIGAFVRLKSFAAKEWRRWFIKRKHSQKALVELNDFGFSNERQTTPNLCNFCGFFESIASLLCYLLLSLLNWQMDEN